MPAFTGFPSGKVHLTPIPANFFSELLPEIDHMGELKVTLYAFWFLDQLEGSIRYLSLHDFTSDQRLLSGLGKTAQEAQRVLADSLERAEQRGTLLKATVHHAGEEETLYFLNSPRGRAAIQALQRGEWAPEQFSHPSVSLEIERPNIFRLYEQNIGPLTPLIADTLREAEQTYPIEWIEEAIQKAVEANVRRWRYVEGILRSRQESEHDEANRGKSQKDRRRYIEGEYGELIEH